MNCSKCGKPIEGDAILHKTSAVGWSEGSSPKAMHPECSKSGYFSKAAEENPWDIAMSETGFWKWLEQNEDSNRVHAKWKYLKSIGYIKGQHWISDKDIEGLNHIHSHYWFMKTRGAL